MINMEKNIRELLKSSIFAHPDDIEGSKKKSSKKGKKPKK